MTTRTTARVRTLQRADRWIGSPLCFILTRWRRLCDRVGTRAAGRHTPKRILFVKLAEQGSTVLARDAIARAVDRVGREHVFFLVFEENRFIIDLLGLIPAANVLTVSTNSAGALAWSGLRRLVHLRRLGIDTCVDLEFLSRMSAALSFLTGCVARIGLHGFFGEGPYRGDLYTHRVLYNAHLHTSQVFSTLVMAIDEDPSAFPAFDVHAPDVPSPPPFVSTEAERTAVASLLRSRGVPAGAPLVLLNPNASDQLPLRRWAPERYVELANRLLAWRTELVVLLTGAPDEAPVVDALAASVGSARCVSVAGLTSLRQLLVLYDMADVLVTNDSGPGHFSALTGIDAVVLFGPETPRLFASLGPRAHPLWAGLACSPCVNAYNNRQTVCRDNLCMQALTVDAVCAMTTGLVDARLAARSTPAIGSPVPAGRPGPA